MVDRAEPVAHRRGVGVVGHVDDVTRMLAANADARPPAALPQHTTAQHAGHEIQRGPGIADDHRHAVQAANRVGGVEIAVRYITRAHERYQLRSKLNQILVDLLGGKAPAVSTTATEAPAKA